MDAKELKEKDEKELLNLLKSNREKFRQLKFELSQGKVKNIREIRKVKKEIARILTLVNKSKKNSSASEGVKSASGSKEK